MKETEKIFANFSLGKLYCSFSGGADSTAALLLAEKFRKIYSFELTAVHFNHHLRGVESDREAENAAAFSASRGIPFIKIDLNIPGNANVESAARTARLEAWKTILPADGAVITGHHSGDRVENLIIRLCRGANSTGLSSMRRRSEVDGMIFIRPLLDWSKKNIIDFLRSEGVTCWAEDSSNADDRYLRNFLRNSWLPELEKYLPGACRGMERSLEALEDDADFIESHVNSIPLEKYHSISFWRNQSRAVKIRMLRKLTGVPPTREMLERLDHEIAFSSPELRRLPLNSGTTLLLQGDRLKIAETAQHDAPLLWDWKKHPETVWNKWIFRAVPVKTPNCTSPDCACFDADRLPDVLEIALPAPGERMSVFGSERREKVKKLRVDRHIPAEPPCPVIRANGEICWAVMVRHSAVAAAGPGCRNIIKLESSRKECNI